MKYLARSILLIGFVLVGVSPAHAKIKNFSAHGKTQAEACSGAKANASEVARLNREEIDWYGECQCSFNKSSDLYYCSVDAKLEDKKKK